MMEKPNNYKVCVRCMTFNQAKYIEETLNGFTMQQTDFPFVCCIVDDASTDGEQEVIKKYMYECFIIEKDSIWETDYGHILFAQHKSNKNCFFAAVLLKENHYSNPKKYGGKKLEYLREWREKSEYEAICEGDDYWIDKDKLQVQADILDNNPSVALVHSDFYFLEEKTSSMTEHKTLECSSKKEMLINIINENRYRIQTMTVLYRVKDYEIVTKSDDFLYKSNYFLMGDTQLWTGLLCIGNIYCVNTPTSVYRVSSNGISHQNDLKKKYRFSLSCSELRLYLLDKYHLSDGSVLSVITKQYNENLLFYKLYDPNFKPIYKPRFVYSFVFNFIFLFRLNHIITFFLKKCKK